MWKIDDISASASVGKQNAIKPLTRETHLWRIIEMGYAFSHGAGMRPRDGSHIDWRSQGQCESNGLDPVQKAIVLTEEVVST